MKTCLLLRYLNIKELFFVLILLLPILTFAQTNQPKKKNGSIKYLKSSNGFNGITLGADISELNAADLAYLDGNSKPDTDSCYTYVYKNKAALTIDTTFSLNMIGVRTYKSKIVNIYLFFWMDDAYKMLSKFLDTYGQFNEKPQEYADIYNWNTRSVKLSLIYAAKVELGVAIFTNNTLIKEVNTDRGKRKEIVDTVADDEVHLSPFRCN